MYKFEQEQKNQEIIKKFPKLEKENREQKRIIEQQKEKIELLEKSIKTYQKNEQDAREYIKTLQSSKG